MSTPEQVLQYNRLRRDVGASDTVLTDPMAELLFTEAGELYTDTAKMTAYTRVLALRGIRASAALLGKYAQNQHQEDLVSVFKNLGELLAYWEGQVTVASDPIEEDESAFFFGLAHGTRGL